MSSQSGFLAATLVYRIRKYCLFKIQNTNINVKAKQVIRRYYCDEYPDNTPGALCYANIKPATTSKHGWADLNLNEASSLRE